MRGRLSSWGLAGLLSLGLALAAIEVSVRVLELFPAAREATRATSERAADADPAGPASRNHVHPYLGWSRRPGLESPLVYWAGRIPLAPDPAEIPRLPRTNALGYYSDVEDYTAVPTERFVVGVFGGSVADQLVLLGGDAFVRELERRVPGLAGRITLLNFGSGGYKQPQAAVSLLKAILLGVPFDLVVNLDGFNEAVFGQADSAAGQHPLLPSRKHWGLTVELASTAPSAETLEISARVLHERERAAWLLRAVGPGAPLGRSEAIRALLGGLALRRLEKARSLEDRLQSQMLSAEKDRDVLAAVPDACLGRRDGCLERVGEIWARSSLAMRDLARSVGAGYLHVLQPNQYVEGSKPLSQEERRYAVGGRQERQRVRAGYPVLQRAGDGLRASGVAFFDLTDVFGQEPETIYRDACCHFNLRGNEILAARIGALAADMLRDGTDSS